MAESVAYGCHAPPPLLLFGANRSAGGLEAAPALWVGHLVFPPLFSFWCE